MNRRLKRAAAELVARASRLDRVGKSDDRSALQALNDEMGGRLPAWYVELLTMFPLCGLELGWRDEDQVDWMLWNDHRGIRSESVECYPGLPILSRGYVNVASDAGGSGDPYFISTDSNDPPVYRVYHDVSDQADQILAQGRNLIAASLSELFRKAVLTDE